VVKFIQDGNMRRNNNKGFSLIELMVVIAIISLIIAIAMPVYLGVREAVTVRSLIASARAAVPELQGWMEMAYSHAHLREADTNCDGQLNEYDMTNGQLLTAGIAKTFAECRNTGRHEKSPWSPQIPLWSNDEAIPPGQITLIEKDYRIRIFGKTINGGIVFENQVEI
jgi:prepilin-type N-terminal cleavage/methylation domain-containing protein